MAARREYVPGEIIYSGYPFVQIVRKGSCLCANCCEEFLPLKSCQKCKFVKYCSKLCQKKSWNNHKLECGILKNLPEHPSQLMIHLTGLLILKIKGKCWEDIYEIEEGRKVTFAGLITHHEAMKMEPLQLLYLKEMKGLLMRFIGDENMPNDEDLWKIIGKVKYNQFSFGGEPNFPDVYALYLNVSKLDHSCIPNAEFSLQHRKLTIQAIAKIHESEKITISYFPAALYPGSSLKSDAVIKSFFGSCQCEDCSKPYGKSVLSKITDESRAYSAVKASENLLKVFDTLQILGMEKSIGNNVDDVLKQQDGVLGNTHILRMRVLALKIIFMDIDPLEKKMELKRLLQYMKQAFGNYHREVRKLYGQLLMTNLVLHDCRDVDKLFEKMKEFTDMGFEAIS